VVAAWAAGNAALTVMLVVYGGPTLGWRAVTYGASSLLALLAALSLLWFRRREAPRLTEAPASSGAPALAAAAACLVGGLAWVFGVFLAYLAVPLLGYAFGKWIAEDRARGEAP
jgi:hypothetical protein